MKKHKQVIRKEVQFEEFIKLLEKSTTPHFVQIAEALGICNDTLIRWKKLPEARAAIAKGISYALRKMEKAGKNDWRMWAEKLKLLGVIVPEKHEHTGPDGEPLKVIFEDAK